MKVKGQFRSLGAFTLGEKSTVTIVQEAGWVPAMVWIVWRRDVEVFWVVRIRNVITRSSYS